MGYVLSRLVTHANAGWRGAYCRTCSAMPYAMSVGDDGLLGGVQLIF